MKNTAKFLFALSMIATLASCGAQPSTGGNSNPEPESVTSVEEASVSTSKIDSLKVNYPNGQDYFELRVGSTTNVASCYKLVAVKGVTLTTTQKKVTVTSSNEAVCKPTGTNTIRLSAESAGEATITVTSNFEKDKSCTFKVVVKDSFFDLSLGVSDPNDDISHDMPTETEGGMIRTSGGVSTYYYVRNSAAVNWYVETKLKVNAVSTGESWPKMGLFADTGDLSGIDYSEHKFFYFLNAEMLQAPSATEASWKYFGFSEYNAGFAWDLNNPLYTHYDHYYEIPEDQPKVNWGTEVKLGLLKERNTFYMFMNDLYIAKFDANESLFFDVDGNPLPCHICFFEFNSDVTFFDYSFDINQDTVNAKIAETKLLTPANESQEGKEDNTTEGGDSTSQEVGA